METEQLRKNINDQLDRLVKQLAELEESKDELDAEEYEELKTDTKEQMKEFGESLHKMTHGNITLTDEMATMKLALQAAISDAFKTPEIISLFAKKQPTQLRLRLAQLERDHKVHKISTDTYLDLKCELLMALLKLGDQLSQEENDLLEQKANTALSNFAKVTGQIGSENKLMEIVNKNMS